MKYSYRKTILFILASTLLLLGIFNSETQYQKFKQDPNVVAFHQQMVTHPAIVDFQDWYQQNIEASPIYKHAVYKASIAYEKASMFKSYAHSTVIDPLIIDILIPLKDKVSKVITEYYNSFLHPYVLISKTFSEDKSNIYLQKFNDYYEIVRPHLKMYYIIISSQARAYWFKLNKRFWEFNSLHVSPRINFIKYYSIEKIWESYISVRITYYASLLPVLKKSIYNFNHVIIPTYFTHLKDEVNNVLIPQVSEDYHSIIAQITKFYKSSYKAYIYPFILKPINYYNKEIYPKFSDVYENTIAPEIFSIYESVISNAKLLYFDYLKPTFFLLLATVKDNLDPFLKNSEGDYYFNVLVKSIFSSLSNNYSLLESKYYEFLTSDPLDEEIARLSSLLSKYAVTSMMTYTAATATASSINPLESKIFDSSVKFLHVEPETAEIIPVQNQIKRWQVLVDETLNDIMEDFHNEFIDYQSAYVNNEFKVNLQNNVKKLNDFINNGYVDLQKYIRLIDSVELFQNSEGFIINSNDIEELSGEKSNNSLNYFINEYPDNAADSHGLTYDNYSQLINEVLYLNDLGYNMTIIAKAEADENFQGRAYILREVLTGKNVSVSFGEVTNWGSDFDFDTFPLFSPGEYIVQSDLLKFITVTISPQNVIDKITRVLVRETFTNVREGLEHKTDIMKNVFENGFYEIQEEFNEMKYSFLEKFDDFSETISDEWDKQFIDLLQHEPKGPEDDEGLLFDIKEIGGEITDHELIEFYESKKELYDVELEKKKRERIRIHHTSNWRNFKEFYKIRKSLNEARQKLIDLEPDLEPTHKVAKEFDNVVGILVSEARQYLDILRAQANLKFQFREERELRDRANRYYKFNPPVEPTEKEIEEKLKESKKIEEEREKTNEKVRKEAEKLKKLNNVIFLKGKPDIEEYIQAKLHRPKNPDEIIPELENNENVEYYYDNDGYAYDGFEGLDEGSEAYSVSEDDKTFDYSDEEDFEKNDEKPVESNEEEEEDDDDDKPEKSVEDKAEDKVEEKVEESLEESQKVEKAEAEFEESEEVENCKVIEPEENEETDEVESQNIEEEESSNDGLKEEKKEEEESIEGDFEYSHEETVSGTVENTSSTESLKSFETASPTVESNSSFTEATIKDEL